MPQLSSTRILCGLAVILIVGGVATWASLENRTSSPTSPATAPGTASMRVAIDPETGELTSVLSSPDKAMDEDLANMLSKSTEGLVEVHHPDGHVYVDLQGRFMSASLARVNDDGSLKTTCVENVAQAESFLAGEDPLADHGHADQPEVK